MFLLHPLAAIALLPTTSHAQTREADDVVPLHFVEVAAAAGALDVSFGRGNAMVDLDGDGLLDLVNTNTGMPNTVLRQRPDHTFEDMASQWNIPQDALASWGNMVADFDNDGDDDLFIVNGGFVEPQPNTLLRNDLSTLGVFTDVSASSGDVNQLGTTFSGTALDIDNDGLLDVFLSNTMGGGLNVLRNLGGLVFEDITAAAGVVQRGGNYMNASAGDFDNDGWIDVGVGNFLFGEPNLLYRNNGDGTFTEVARDVGVLWPFGKTFGSAFADFDNDGWQDLYVPLYMSVAPSISTRLQNGQDPDRLYRNLGDGTFQDVTGGSGMTGQSDMGHNVGDLDADGYPDIFIGTGAPLQADEDVLFRITPVPNGFLATDVSDVSGITANGPTRGHGMAFGDYDRDGDIDIYMNNGGPDSLPDTIQEASLFRNAGNLNRWVAVDLEGKMSNRTAVGARSMAVTASGREIHLFLTAGYCFGNTNSHTQFFGLGSEDQVDRIEVRWPSGIRQTLVQPVIETTHALVETGIVEVGQAEVGGPATLAISGPAHAAVTFQMGGSVQADAAYGGMEFLEGPTQNVGVAVLDDDGLGQHGIDIPAGVDHPGGVFYVQALVSQAIGPAVPTNVVRLEVQ